MYISGTKFEASRDILYSVFYQFSCTPHDIITFVKTPMSLKQKKEKENAVLLYYEKPLK